LLQVVLVEVLIVSVVDSCACGWDPASSRNGSDGGLAVVLLLLLL